MSKGRPQYVITASVEELKLKLQGDGHILCSPSRIINEWCEKHILNLCDVEYLAKSLGEDIIASSLVNAWLFNNTHSTVAKDIIIILPLFSEPLRFSMFEKWLNVKYNFADKRDMDMILSREECGEVLSLMAPRHQEDAMKIIETKKIILTKRNVDRLPSSALYRGADGDEIFSDKKKDEVLRWANDVTVESGEVDFPKTNVEVRGDAESAISGKKSAENSNFF